MQPPDELMTGVFLPSMRHLVAVRLRSRGLSQSKISALLGVTQASVSLYLSANPKKAYDQLSKLSITKSQAEGDASRLAQALLTGAAYGVKTLDQIWTSLLGSGAACDAHRKMYPSLADCDFCVKEYGGKQGVLSEVVSEVADAAKLLEDSPEFIGVMPEVSVNIACAAPGATGPGDIVAIPGRIVKVRDRAKAMLPPEAGASAHMSRVLLMVMNKRPQFRACINVRYDRKMEKVAKKKGLRTLTIGRYQAAGGDPTSDALEKKLKSAPPAFEAIVDEGGAGIEPNLYLFAKGAREVAELALRMAKDYSAG